jgi:hypothetical protein
MQPCHYCGGMLLDETGCGLDRRNNSIGYTIENVLPCCGVCNQIRNVHLTVKEMEVAMGAVLMYRDKVERFKLMFLDSIKKMLGQ